MRSSPAPTRDLFRSWVNLLAILAAFFTNILANVRPLNGMSIGEISNTVFKEVLIIPANYAFAIWGLIYISLISLGIYWVLPRNRSRLAYLGYGLAIASVIQIIWVILFQLGLFTLSLGAMIGILGALIAVYRGLRTDIKHYRWVNFPVSVYLGWICVATIVNAASVLYAINGNDWGLPASIWTVLILTVGAALAVYIGLKKADRAYIGVFIWAYTAIAVKHMDNSVIAIGAILLSVLLLLSFFKCK